MSADPVTLAVASFAVQAVGTYQGIQAQKAQNKAIIREYETERKYNALKGIQDSNDVLEAAEKKRKINKLEGWLRGGAVGWGWGGGKGVTLFELGIFIPAPVPVFEGGGIVLHNYHTTSNN